MKIAIYSMGFIGDVIISFRLAAALKNASPDNQVFMVVPPLLFEIANAISQVESVIPFDKKSVHSGSKGIGVVSSQINQIKPDAFINLHPGLRANRIASKLSVSAKSNLRYNNSLGKHLRRGVSIKYQKGISELERLKQFYNLLENQPFNPKIDLRFSSETELSVKNLVTSDKPILLIFPGSAWRTKQWPSSRYNQLVRELSRYQVIVCGSESETELTANVAQETDAIDLGGRLTLLETLYLIDSSEKVVSNDSAPTHMANLVGTSVITIFGPTSPMFGFSPTETNDSIVYKPTECSPCSIHGPNKCPLGHHDCMKSISVEEVIQALN